MRDPVEHDARVPPERPHRARRLDRARKDVRSGYMVGGIKKREQPWRVGGRPFAALCWQPHSNAFIRKVVHDLVHAKVIAMGDVEVRLPFTEGTVEADPPPDNHKEDHNGKFSKEVDELMKNLPK
jgi:hypothetical protein